MRTELHPGELPRAVLEAIVRRLRAERGVALVRGKGGRLSVRSLDGYNRLRKRMRTRILVQQPWRARRKAAARDPLWPVGSRPIGIKGRVTRADIYDDR